ncbi:MAG: molybdate ABC transporter substrate-binding protein [Desulfovibrionales bacterium]|nr:molybdate ABC transporter substrate-binding protein [Desulfovibrionales bacterium]
MKRLCTLLLLLSVMLPVQAHAADLIIAQAANFMPTMKEIIPAFEKETGLKVQATYTSQGKLYGQILNGAPFDMFLSANALLPEKLFADQRATEPFVYARGQLVLWTTHKEFCEKPWQETVQSPAVSQLAIANTETAAYGAVAKIALEKEGLWNALKPNLAVGQTISQVFQYVESGAADVGFCAYSYMFTPKAKKGCYVLIPEAPTTIQKACILKNSPHKEAARKFAAFMKSPKVTAIRQKYGYK